MGSNLAEIDPVKNSSCGVSLKTKSKQHYKLEDGQTSRLLLLER